MLSRVSVKNELLSPVAIDRDVWNMSLLCLRSGYEMDGARESCP